VAGLGGGVAATRLGARRAVLIGLTLVGLASLGFAFAGGFWSLFAARLLQGGGSGFTWAGAFAWLLAAVPRERRGQMMGTAMGSATFGALFGPVVGAAAIGAVWLTSAALETVQAPLAGRMSDRSGPLRPTRIALVGAAVVSLALAAGSRPAAYAPLIVVAALFYGVLFTTAFALLAD